MGRSTFDIPTHFLAPGMKDTFLSWLKSIPTDPNAKRRLLSIWADATRVKLTKLDYSNLFSKSGE